jgi:hypothetical protein
MAAPELPDSLRRWFVAHFVADYVFAIPLLIAPTWLLGSLGWEHPDPVTARLVAAALIGIGGQSLLGRHDSVAAYRAMLNLKLLWSAAALVGLFLSMVSGAPPFTWAVFAVFLAFFGVWFYYRVRLKQIGAMAERPDDEPAQDGDGDLGAAAGPRVETPRGLS